MEKKKLTLIIPAYNESGSIVRTIVRTRALEKDQNLEIEIIVINDGSTDDTAKEALEAGAKVINHPINIGYGLSLQHGIETASHNLIAITDADGTYPIEKIPKLLGMIERGFDMAVGARRGREYRKGLWKYPARLAFKWLAEYVAGRKIPDINSGLRVMRKEKLLPHYKRTCFGFSFTTSITLIFMLNGYFVGYTPIPYEKRIGKSKVRHFRDTLRTAQIMISVISFYNPIKLFLLMAVSSGLLGFLLLIAGKIWDLYAPSSVGAILVALSPLILSLGFLAETIRLKK